jgi:AraC-like DNA-binding protein
VSRSVRASMYQPPVRALAWSVKHRFGLLAPRHELARFARGLQDARCAMIGAMNRPAVPLSRHLLRVRDLIDRAYAEQLDIAALARSASVSPAYFSRSFKAAFGETPHQYLISRRMERAMALLRSRKLSVTEVCFAVGFSSLGSFSTQFRRLVGESPLVYRQRGGHDDLAKVPHCYVRRFTRPRR